MPMLYVIQNGFNGTKITPPNDIVYCVTNLNNILKENIPFIFTTGHANNALTQFIDSSQISQIKSLIDFDAVTKRFWNDESDKDLKRKKEAELLIAKDLPFASLEKFITHSDYTKNQLIDLGYNQNCIFVEKDYYF